VPPAACHFAPAWLARQRAVRPLQQLSSSEARARSAAAAAQEQQHAAAARAVAHAKEAQQAYPTPQLLQYGAAPSMAAQRVVAAEPGYGGGSGAYGAAATARRESALRPGPAAAAFAAASAAAYLQPASDSVPQVCLSA
jgi:hypothetical protein